MRTRLMFYDEHRVRYLIGFLLLYLGAESAGFAQLGAIPFWNFPTQQDSAVARATDQYTVRKEMTFLFGKHYRDVWAVPLRLPKLNMKREAGGLVSEQRGGGMQTLSLRLKGNDGYQYVLRLVNKNPEKILPPVFRGTVAASILQDQISASHPYAALVVAPLAQTIGIYHASPRLVWVPADLNLGLNQQDFGGSVALLEERPEGDESAHPQFGFAHKIVDTQRMWADSHADYRHRTDARAFAWARLFDMWLGDWDRHEDQWRWAVIRKGNQTLYRPIPRDRDQAFARYDGLIPYLGTRKWSARRFQTFAPHFTDIKGLNFNAGRIDRMLLTELTQADWINLADSLAKCLTDDVIDHALQAWPVAVYRLHGATISRTLKARRAALPAVSIAYYRILARTVTIMGTQQQDHFLIDRLKTGQTSIRIVTGNGDKQPGDTLYYRLFHANQTREIRLFGLDGDDQFIERGESKRGIRIRIIGGPGQDQLVEQETDSKPTTRINQRIWVYDTMKGIRLPANTVAHRRLSSKSAVNRFDSTFQYDFARPILQPGWNVDDGLVLGGGILVGHHGFHKVPVAAIHQLTAGFAFRTKALRFHYEGRFHSIIDGWNLLVGAEAGVANWVYNFYGLGNETVRLDSDVLPSSQLSYYRLRFNQYELNGRLSRELTTSSTLELGLQYKYTVIRQQENRISSSEASGLTQADFGTKPYAGITVNYRFDKTDNLLQPQRGLRAEISAGWLRSLTGTNAYAPLAVNISGYWPISRNRLGLAIRIGGSTIFGQFEFFQANTLGGTSNLRGYPRNRYSGRSSLYQNLELRVRLFEFKSFLTRGQFGLLALSDNGRVWADGEASTRWHQGYGGGIWLAPFDLAILSAVGSFSTDGAFISIRSGFFF